MQLRVNDDRAHNVTRAGQAVAQAASAGAQIVVLPELWNYMGDVEALVAHAEPLDGPSLDAARAWARRDRVHIVAGSVLTRTPDRDRPANTMVVVGPEGEILATYRKIHLFDLKLDDVVSRESAHRTGGREIVTVDVCGWRLGLSICFDVRFPELYRVLRQRGAHLVVVPAAFAARTGKDHWELLLRARAVENQVFVAAPAQWGTPLPGRSMHGRSSIIDPWGVVVAQASDGDATLVTELDPGLLARARSALSPLPREVVWSQMAFGAAQEAV